MNFESECVAVQIHPRDIAKAYGRIMNDAKSLAIGQPWVTPSLANEVPPEKPSWEFTSSHLLYTLDPERLSNKIEEAVKALSAAEFEGIAVTGVSGIAFGASLSVRLKRPLVIIRKEERPRPHSQKEVEGPDSLSTYVFVDDLIDSGATLSRVTRQIITRYPKCKCVGVFCYYSTPHRYKLPLDLQNLRIYE